MTDDSCFFDNSGEGCVYILRLEKNKYYVGYSKEVETRVASHFLGNGALFTKKYKPLEVMSVKHGDLLLENATTIALMATHGFENVRGGKYCKMEMTSPPASLAKALKYLPDASST